MAGLAAAAGAEGRRAATATAGPEQLRHPGKVSDNRLRGFIDREVRRVRDAPMGGRHNARLAAARSIGGVAAEAGLSDTEVEEMLIAARPPEVEEEKERQDDPRRPRLRAGGADRPEHAARQRTVSRASAASRQRRGATTAAGRAGNNHTPTRTPEPPPERDPDEPAAADR